MDALDILMLLRLQISCACVTLFVAIPFFAIKRTTDFAHKLFRYVLIFQVISLSFDMITVYTVNRLSTVPAVINKLCHIVFIFSLCVFIYLTFLYVKHMVTEDDRKIPFFVYGLPVILSLFILIFAPLYYVETEWGNYSAGPGATAVYCIVGIYMIMTLYIMLKYWKRIDSEKRRVMMFALLTELFFSLIQLFIPTILMSSLGTSLVTLAIYLTLENPDRILRKMYLKEKLDLLDKVHYDALTGIYNRRFVEENMNRIIKSISRSQGMLSVMMLDVDFFKKYNDTYGHKKGDDCLKTIAKALDNSMTRDGDFVARYGGEEFVIVLPNTDETDACVIANRILENILACNIPHKKNDVASCVTISIGVTAGKAKHKYNGDNYIKRADDALYMSKTDGRNKYTFLSFE